MKILVIVSFTVLLVGCGTPVSLTSSEDGPAWATELASEVEKGKEAEAGKVRVKGKGKARPKVEPRTVNDMVTPPPVTPEPEPEKPEWVADLEDKVEVKTVSKKSRRQDIKSDLVEVAPEPEQPAPAAPAPANQAPAKVDFIFIVDSSNSMDHFLRRVKRTFAGFLPTIDASLDWKIMFTHADHGDHGFFLANWASSEGRAFSLERDGRRLLGEKYLTKNMEDYRTVFIDTLRLHDVYEYYDDNSGGDQELDSCDLPPGCQGWNEQPLKALQGAFVRNRSFFRPGADVAAVIFSDSDEGEHTEPEKRVKAQDVVKAFHAEWGDEGKRFIAYPIIMIPGEDEECMKKYSSGFWGGEGVFGVEIARMAKVTNGTSSSLCANSYTPLARKIVSDFNSRD